MPEMVDFRYLLMMAMVAILTVIIAAIFLRDLHEANVRIKELEEERELEQGMGDMDVEEKIEEFAKALHEANREALKHTFFEWHQITETARETRRIQARHILANFEVNLRE